LSQAVDRVLTRLAALCRRINEDSERQAANQFHTGGF
jgi:hypothetical protein